MSEQETSPPVAGPPPAGPPWAPPAPPTPVPPRATGSRRGRTALVALVAAGVGAGGLFAADQLVSADDEPSTIEVSSATSVPAEQPAPPDEPPRDGPADPVPDDGAGEDAPDVPDLDRFLDELRRDLPELGDFGIPGVDLAALDECLAPLADELEREWDELTGGAAHVVVQGPDGVTVLTLGEGDGAVTVRVDGGRVTVESDGDVTTVEPEDVTAGLEDGLDRALAELERCGIDLPIPDLGGLDLGDLAD